MKNIVEKAVFENDSEALNKIKSGIDKRQIKFSSIRPLYKKIAEGSVGGFTVPAINVRTLTYDMARSIFRAARKENAGPFIFEIARSEMKYTDQPPRKYMASIAGAAIEEEYSGPIFLQGDHFKVHKDKYYGTEKEKELDEIKDLIKESANNGFYNIDIDASSLKLKDNIQETVKFTLFIKDISSGMPQISIGAEVGEIGGKNTSINDLRAFLDGYISKVDTSQGIMKIAAQTGTSHGGVVLPSGELKVMDEDFELLKQLSEEAKKYGLAGVVQHGASTLPDSYFSKFPKSGACEIHLATGFQNIIYDSSYFPKDLKEDIYNWLKKNYFNLRKEEETDEQFLYKNRKRALGAFKKQIWAISQEKINNISEELEEKFKELFRSLKISDTTDIIEEIYK